MAAAVEDVDSPTGPTTNSALAERVLLESHPLLYLSRLETGMQQLGFPSNDPLYRAVRDSYNAMKRLVENCQRSSNP